MAGIYIHIPFCKQRCTYCDFYKEIGTQYIDQFIDALTSEIHLQKYYLKGNQIDTIYFGGGTPSILNYNQFRSIFETISLVFDVKKEAEITLEANPDDLTIEYSEKLSRLPFNRLSIGIQSFEIKDLQKINRRHNVQQAKKAVINARKAGFNNISIDIIYGLPGQTSDSFKKQLQEAYRLNVEHISAYGLTYEIGTQLWQQRNKGLVKQVSDEVMIQMYNYMYLEMNDNGFEAYEISNFAKSGFRSRHNSAYWKFIPYVGLGPSAHSFDGKSRQWNISSIKQYIEKIEQNKIFYEKEILSTNDFYNDFIMVSLRTKEGIDLSVIKEKMGGKYRDYCLDKSSRHLYNKHLIKNNNMIFLSLTGISISNIIIMDLMWTD